MGKGRLEAFSDGVIAIIITIMMALIQTPASAHNGAVALAVPVAGITPDGDLSDWPASARWNAFSTLVAGTHPDNPEDFSGRFSAAYSAEENALYAAVEVRDQSAVSERSEWSEWHVQDGCQLYLDWQHGEQRQLVQYVIYGDKRLAYPGDGVEELAGRAEVRMGVQRRSGVHQYEWRVDLGALSAGRAQLQPGMVLGLGVGASDVDADGSASWLGWGSVVVNPYQPQDEIGDLILVGREAQLGQLAGSAVWARTGTALRFGKVRVEGQGMHITVRTDRAGQYRVEVPAGRYRVSPWADQPSSGAAVEVGSASTVQSQVRVPFPQGVVTSAGPGKEKPMGAGSHQGAWRLLGREDGLPAYVRALAQDQQGRMWFDHGAVMGVSCCDGQECRDFSPEDGLPSYPVYALHADRQGNMWFGTEGGGVSRYDGKEFRIFTTREGLAHDVVRAIAEDHQGNMWFGTEGGGVSRYDGYSFTTFTDEDGLGNNSVRALAVDQQGQMWFGTWGGGVSRYDRKGFKTFTTREGLSDNLVLTSFADREGNMWFGTERGGVCKYDGRGFTRFSVEEGLAEHWVNAIAEDRLGNLWFLTKEKGVSRYDGERFTTFTAEGLGFKGGQAALEDREGNLWFGSWGSGVSCYTGARFDNRSAAEGLAGSNAWAVGEDAQQNLWFAFRDGGVSRYDGKSIANFTPTEGLAHTCVRSLLIDHRGVLWFGTEKKGVSRYDGKTWKTFTTANGLVNDDVLAIAEDLQGNIWFGTEKGGVSWFDGKHFASLTTAEGLPDNNTSALLADRSGLMWVGTGKGIWRYDGQQGTVLAEKEGRPAGGGSALLEDRQGRVWVGGEKGLSLYEGGHFSREFSAEDGLPEALVRCLLEDREGRLWIGTDGGGMGVYDGQVFQRLSRRDGLAQNVVHDILQDRAGDLWFATEGGISHYRPNRTPPLVLIEEVTAERPYGPVERVSIPTTQDYLAFAFRSLTFRPADALVYRYRLAGYDRDWRTTHGSKAEYQDLPLGEYVFEVQAVDQDLNYSARPARVRVEVRFPYERLGWMGALALSVGLVLWQTLQVVRRDRRLHQSNQALSLANKELHRVSLAKSSFLASMSHELRTPMNAILGFAQLLRKNTEAHLSALELSNVEVIRRNAGELLVLIEQLLDLSRIEAGRMQVLVETFPVEEVVGESLAVVEPLVGDKRVQLQAEYEGERELLLATDRSKVKQILVNLLSNGVKFTERGSVWVWARVGEEQVRFEVRDTGVGIAGEELEGIFEEFRQVRHPGMGQGTGLGLAITRRLCRLLGGEVEVESQVGRGSTFTVRLPRVFRTSG